MPVQAPRPAPQYGTPFDIVSVRKLEPYWVEMFDGAGEKKALLVLAGRGHDVRLRFMDMTNLAATRALRPAGPRLYEALRGYVPGLDEVEHFEEEDHQLPDVLAEKVTSLAPESGSR